MSRVKAVGIDVPGRPVADTFGHPAADTFGPTPVELPRLSCPDSSKFRFGSGKLTQAVDAEEREGSRPDSDASFSNRWWDEVSVANSEGPAVRRSADTG